MGDPNLNGAQENLFGNYIVQRGLANPALRDEILVQVANQVSSCFLFGQRKKQRRRELRRRALTTSERVCQVWRNPNALNSERGWLLLSSCLGAFLPSLRLAKYLLKWDPKWFMTQFII